MTLDTALTIYLHGVAIGFALWSILIVMGFMVKAWKLSDWKDLLGGYQMVILWPWILVVIYVRDIKNITVNLWKGGY